MHIFIFMLVISALAFGYTLAPLTQVSPRARRSGSRPKHKKAETAVSSVDLEEASLELATGRLSDEDYASFVQSMKAEQKPKDDEIEREIQRIRKKSRKR